MYVIGMTLFLLFEVSVGQQGNVYIDGDVNGTSWLELDVLLFYNSVTTTTIGYGANFYPRNASGRVYLIVFSWIALANTAFLIIAISDFVKERAAKRWQINRKDLMITTGLDELESLLDEAGIARDKSMDSGRTEAKGPKHKSFKMTGSQRGAVNEEHDPLDPDLKLRL